MLPANVLRCLLLALLLPLTVAAARAQSTEELKNKRAALMAEINDNNRKLKDTRRNKAAALEQVNLLGAQISKRRELIATLEKEISYTDAGITRTTEVVAALTEDVDRLEAEYTRMIRAAYRSRLRNTWLSFLLSSKSFNEAFRRWRYLRQYQRFRSRQARLIVATQRSLRGKLELLEARSSEKKELLRSAENQELAIGREKSAQDRLLNKLSKNESAIVATLKKQEAAREEMNQAIENAIAVEMARIRKAERARKTTASTPKPSAPARTAAADDAPAADFGKQRGRLPWPINGEIVKKFGRQPHPTVKGVEISNNGIDISVSGDTDVRSVAAGTVVSTHFVPGYRNMVLIRHGDYYTVYSNLESVSVNGGAALNAGQSIGRISDRAGDLHFEVWRKKERLNPERWIQK